MHLRLNRLYMFWGVFFIFTRNGICENPRYQHDRILIEESVLVYEQKPEIESFDYAFLKLQELKNKIIHEAILLDPVKNSGDDSLFKRKPWLQFLAVPSSPLTTKEIQKQCLNTNEALLDFMVLNDRIRVFIVTSDTFHVATCMIQHEALYLHLSGLLSQLFHSNNPLQLSFDLNLAHELYKQLFLPLEKYLTGVNSLMIIPDDILVGFPFECLIIKGATDRNADGDLLYDHFKNMTYLIHRYAVAYNFSSIALDPKYFAPHTKKESGRKLLTMSQIDDVPVDDESQSLHTGFENEEVIRVSRILWLRENIKGIRATKKYFVDRCSEFRWIYLTLPAVFDHSNLRFSGLYFSKSLDSEDSSRILTLSEIIQCDLKADLLTLSRCVTRPAIHDYPPGLLSFPQAFLVAGARSLMFNLWTVHDISVSKFMTKFYWELKYKRQTNEFALKEAKLNSLKGSFKYQGREISRAHPYFWATFILIGDVNVRPPTFSTVPPKMVVLIVYVLIILFSLFIVKKTKNM